MFRKSKDKQVYKIYIRVLYSPQYQELAKKYRDAIHALQMISQTFTPEQWKAVTDYKEAFLQLHQTMIRIALHKKQ